MSRYRVGVLLYFYSKDGRILLIRRRKAPNLGLWCAVGGKLEMSEGESPAECARREALEEVGVSIEDSDLRLRCMLSEKDYEGTGHWLMFVYEIRDLLDTLPAEIDEGEFAFFPISELESLEMPPLDKRLLLECFANPSASEFHSIHVGDASGGGSPAYAIEESIGGSGNPL